MVWRPGLAEPCNTLEPLPYRQSPLLPGILASDPPHATAQQTPGAHTLGLGLPCWSKGSLTCSWQAATSVSWTLLRLSSNSEV